MSSLLLAFAVSLMAPPPTPTLQSLDWLAGTWVRVEPDGRAEEVWSVPAGDSILGMFRLQKQGVTRFVELQTIQVEAGAWVLRIRHLDPRLGTLSDEPEPLRYTARVVAKDEVAFEHPTDRMKVIRYKRTRTPAVDSLLVRLEKRSGGNVDFVFQRSK